MSDINIEQTRDAVAAAGKQLPEPKGYRILCAVPQADDTFGESKIVKPDSLVKAEETGTVILFVLALGSEAYSDTARFPNGAWCRKGDFILVRAYAGTRFKIHGQEFRLINDDTVEAVVQDPRGFSRA